MAFQFLIPKKRTSNPQDLSTTVLTQEETVRLDAALSGEDGWVPDRRLLAAAERYHKAIAEGRLKAR